MHDTANDPESASPAGDDVATASRQYRDRDRRRRRRFWTVVGAAVAVAGAATLWFAVADHPAETAVEEFFAALQDGDAEAALALVEDAALADAPRPEFQVPEALGGDWELTGTEATRTDADDATVTAEFATPDGTRRGEYRLGLADAEGGDWRLRDPFVRVEVEAGGTIPGPFDYLQVDGVIAELRDSEGVLTLFPGVHRFYQDVPGVVDVADAEPTALFGTDELAVAAPAATAGPDAVAAVQRLVDDRLAQCLESVQTAPRGCPFGLLEGTDVRTREGVVDFFTDDAEWRLETYPPIAIADRAAGSPGLFAIQGVDPADTVALTARGSDGDLEVEFTTACTFDFSVWALHLTADDGAVAFAFAPESGARVAASTCDTEPDE